MSNIFRKTKAGTQVSSWQQSSNTVTPNQQTSFILPHGLTLRHTINAGTTSVTIPAGITWVYAICVGGGGGGRFGRGTGGGGAGGVAWGWTLATSSCVVGAGGVGSTRGDYTRYGHIIAGGGGSVNTGPLLGGAGGGSTASGAGATNYYGMPGAAITTTGNIGNIGGGAGSGGDNGTAGGTGGRGGNGISGGGGGGTTPTLSDVLNASGLLADGDYLLTDAATKISIESLGGGGSQTLDQVLTTGPTGLRPMYLIVNNDNALTITSTSGDNDYNAINLISDGDGINTRSINRASLRADMGPNTISGIEVSAHSSTTGLPLRITKDLSTKAYIDKDGNNVATSFKLWGGTGTNVLLDNGTTATLPTLQNVINRNNTSTEGFTIDNRTTNDSVAQGVSVILSNDAETTGYGVTVSATNIQGPGYPFLYIQNNIFKFYVTTTGAVRGTSFSIGGTSSQYLMADGSVSTGGSGSSGFEQNFLLMGA